MISMIDIGWVAGIVEGEGTIVAERRGGIAIRVGMTDKDIIERLASLWQVGHRVHQQDSRKDIFITNVYGKKAAQWMMTLYPILGVRRRASVCRALALWNTIELPRSERMSCRRGHLYDTSNTRIYTYKDGSTHRVCRICESRKGRNIHVVSTDVLAMLEGKS